MSDTFFPSNHDSLLFAKVLHTFFEIASALFRDIFGPVSPIVKDSRLKPIDNPMKM